MNSAKLSQAEAQSETKEAAEKLLLRWRNTADAVIKRVELTESEQRNFLTELLQGEPTLKQAKELLEEAKERAMPQKRKAAYKPGEVINLKITPWLVEGVLREGVNNLLVALPKTGKSALLGAMVGAMAKQAQTFLGRKVKSCDEVHLIWPDMPLEDAVYILEREGLWSGTGVIKDDDGEVVEVIGTPRAPIVELVTAGLDVREWDFRPANLARYRQEALEAKERGVKAFWGFDCYEIMCGFVGGFDENKSEAGRPAREMCIAFAETGATTMTIHHSNKTGGGTAVISASGHASITRPFSTLTQMAWLRPSKDGAPQKDMRVVISQIGRRGSGQLVAELTDDGWVQHGEGDEVSVKDRLEELWLEIGDTRQGDAFDHIVARTRLNFGVPVNELAGVMERPANKIQRYLSGLVRKGLIEIEKSGLKTAGRPADLYWAKYDPETGEHFARARVSLGEGGDIESRGKSQNNGSQSQADGVEGGQEGIEPQALTPTFETTPRPAGTRQWGAIAETLYMQPVELFEHGKWFNGWKCSKCDSPDDLHLFKMVGGEIWKRTGKRWELDVRLCQTVTPSEPEPTEPTYDPEELF